MRVDVLMLSAAHPPDDVRIVRKEGAALAAAGWRVMHLCPGAPGVPEVIDGVLIGTYARRRGWWGRVRNIPRLAGLARLMQPRAIHAHEPDAWLAALMARGGRGRNGGGSGAQSSAQSSAPARAGGNSAGWEEGASDTLYVHPRVVLDVHEHYPSRLDSCLPAALRGLARLALRGMCRAMARRADSVIVAKDGLAQDYGRDCVAVRNYAEAPLVAPRAHRAGPVMLLHLGAISRARGWPQLLAALALGGAGVTIAGRFTDGSEADFHSEAARLGLASRIHILGWLPPAEMAAVAAACDVNLVLFQPGEENHRLALPHKLADGMLAGLPVIAPAFATEVASMVKEAGCGLLVDVTDPAAIAAAVQALHDPELRARLGGAGRAAALGRYGWAGQAAALATLYRRLLGRPDGAAV